MNSYPQEDLRFSEFVERRVNQKVIAHIAGPSGSGKTTLLNKLSKQYPSVNFKDLDDFDDEAVELLGWKDTHKNKFTDRMLKALADKRQKLMDEYIVSSKKPIVFGGHHTEGDYILRIPTKNRWRLDVDASTSALRAYHRSQRGDQKFRKLKSELPQDKKEAQEIIDFLNDNNYAPMSAEDISEWMERNIK